MTTIPLWTDSSVRGLLDQAVEHPVWRVCCKEISPERSAFAVRVRVWDAIDDTLEERMENPVEAGLQVSLWGLE